MSDKIHAAIKPQTFAIIENHMVTDVITVDIDEYSLEQIQDLFGGGNLVRFLPEDYGIGDFYDAGADEWTKAEPPRSFGFSFDGDEENKENDKNEGRTNGR